jgi:hypothetical protein
MKLLFFFFKVVSAVRTPVRAYKYGQTPCQFAEQKQGQHGHSLRLNLLQPRRFRIGAGSSIVFEFIIHCFPLKRPFLVS